MTPAQVRIEFLKADIRLDKAIQLNKNFPSEYAKARLDAARIIARQAYSSYLNSSK